MSQFTAEVFGLTQEELVEFLNVQVVNVVPPPPPTEPPTPGSGAYGILVFSIVLLVIAAMSFVVSAVLWYSYRKRTQEVDKKKALEDHERENEKKARLDDLDATDGKPATDTSRLAALEAPPFDEEELKKVKTKEIDISASYYTFRERLQVNLRNISLEPVNEMISQNAYLYAIIVVEPEKDVFFESDLRPVAEENEFDETAEFDILASELSECTLRVNVFACDRFSRHRLITESIYKMAIEKGLEERDGEEQEQPTMIPVQLNNVSSRSGTPTRKSSEERVGKNGEVMFSLCYMPTSGRLTFVALKGRSICKAKDVPIITYLRVSLTIGGKTLKTVQTSTIRRSSNPIYNEAFLFHAPFERIKDTDITVTVMIQDQNAKSAVVLGKITVGPESYSHVGRKHFEAMLMSPRKPVAQWHTIEKK